MFLKSLEINGFKSFGQKTVFNFIPGVTAIVGPNGSGKSNIAESIRWVMGEQSLKSIRSKDGSDLIFNGSLSKQRLNKAQVNLYFDNNLKKMPIDFDEVVVSRVVYREGVNEYYINNNQVRLKDVADLLAASNVGQRNFSVISQGLSDSLIKLNPKELKAVIQDAAGIRPVEIKKEDALKKLKNTRENIGKIELMKSEISPYLRNLKKQVSRFEQKEELEAKLKELKQTKFNYEINQLLENKNIILNQKEDLYKKIKDAEEELVNIKEEIKKLEKTLGSNSEVLIELDKRIDYLQEEKLYHEKEISIIDSRLEIEKEKRKIVFSIDLNYVKSRLKGIINIISDSLGKESLFTKEWVANVLSSLKDFLNEVESGDRTSEKEELNEETKQLEDKALEKKKELQNKLNLILLDLEKDKNKLRVIKDEESPKKNKLFDLERRLRELEDNKYRFEERLKNINAQINHIETKEKIIKENDFELNPDLVKRISSEEIAKAEMEIVRIERILEEAVGFDKNLTEEYNRIKERYDLLEKECKDLSSAVEDLNKLIKELDLNIEKQFRDAFIIINEKFDLYFKMIFAGGKAKIAKIEFDTENEAEGEEDEEKEEQDKDSPVVNYGIEIKAELPGKKAYNLNMFSGGERSLTAIALLFSLVGVANPPFIVLDEIDAALDEANSRRFANVLKEFTDKTQFIIITHNRETMSYAGALYGITMANDGVSKVFSLKLEEAIK